MAEVEGAPQQAVQQLTAPLAGLGVSSELKSALAFALDHLCAVRPEDPVDYLARKLYEYEEIMHPKAVDDGRGTSSGEIVGARSTHKDLQIRTPAPDFCLASFQKGRKSLYQLSKSKGKYVVLLFYPCDFTYVDPTELLAFDAAMDQFAKLETDIVAISADSAQCHRAWADIERFDGGIANISIPLLSDPQLHVSAAYGMCDQADAKSRPAGGGCCRGTVIISASGIVQYKAMHDRQVGRNCDEIVRLIRAFKHHDATGDHCPANWRPGNRSLKPTQQAILRYCDAMYG